MDTLLLVIDAVCAGLWVALILTVGGVIYSVVSGIRRQRFYVITLDEMVYAASIAFLAGGGYFAQLLIRNTYPSLF